MISRPIQHQSYCTRLADLPAARAMRETRARKLSSLASCYCETGMRTRWGICDGSSTSEFAQCFNGQYRQRWFSIAPNTRPQDRGRFPDRPGRKLSKRGVSTTATPTKASASASANLGGQIGPPSVRCGISRAKFRRCSPRGLIRECAKPAARPTARRRCDPGDAASAVGYASATRFGLTRRAGTLGDTPG